MSNHFRNCLVVVPVSSPNLMPPALLPLPLQRYEMAHFKTVKVHIDYHVEVDRHRYSVPHSLVGQVLEARMTATIVEVLHRGQRVASHALNQREGGFSTIPEHMPAAHRAQMEWTPKRLIHWGESIGPATASRARLPRLSGLTVTGKALWQAASRGGEYVGFADWRLPIPPCV